MFRLQVMQNSLNHYKLRVCCLLQHGKILGIAIYLNSKINGSLTPFYKKGNLMLKVRLLL
jgi:hypothetical protein